MSAIKLSENIYSVGVLNPNLRVFDVIMKTEYGTSYNSYIVKGNDKTALIDTCHLSFEDGYIENIKQVCDLDKIDYIILNHNEPDHSGSLADLSDLIPNATILASQAGSIYLKNITNKQNLNIKAVKDGETIDLGGRTLKFIMAPFLHWPDTMFTYVEEEQTVFTCDFLGAHYCEPRMIDSKIQYINEYKNALEYYYDCIMGPFKTYVAKGLDKLNAISFNTVCTSHGPVLTRDGYLDYCLEMYKQWSTEQEEEEKVFNIPIFYCTAYGNTHILSEQIAKGIEETLSEKNIKANIPLYNIIEHDIDKLACDLNSSDGFLLGSPTINKNAVPPIWILLSHTDAINCRNKPAAAFGSFGWSGEAVKQINSFLTGLSYKVVNDGLKVAFVPGEKDIKDAFEFGKEFGLHLVDNK